MFVLLWLNLKSVLLKSENIINCIKQHYTFLSFTEFLQDMKNRQSNLKTNVNIMKKQWQD